MLDSGGCADASVTAGKDCKLQAQDGTGRDNAVANKLPILSGRLTNGLRACVFIVFLHFYQISFLAQVLLEKQNR